MPSTFGKYRLIQRIGGSQLSQVYRVGRMDTPGNTGVALKRVDPRLIGNQDFVQLVTREAGILSRMKHPNLCVCHEMGLVDGCAFLTLDLVRGCTLRALMRRASQMDIPLPTSTAIALCYQLAQVLDYLHRKCAHTIVHLDLSPQNVMVSQKGEIRLIDFGIARRLDGQNPPPLGGKIAGTVGYMSPEQARGEKTLGSSADLFGLGILLWEMLTGQRLFRGNTPETWERMRTGEVPAHNAAMNKHPKAMTELVLSLLAPDPEARPSEIGEILPKLEECSSSPNSGRRPLAALITRLMGEPDFDPFDKIDIEEEGIPLSNIPTGEKDAVLGYEELCIQIDQGEGSPCAHIRAAVPNEQEVPSSPFLEH
ncbi:MAG: serine/threonine-protein kinase [Pseudomonadota bacterium]